MTFRYGERSYVEANHLINADRTCGTLLSHEILGQQGIMGPKGAELLCQSLEEENGRDTCWGGAPCAAWGGTPSPLVLLFLRCAL